MAAVDRRAQAYVLMSGTVSFSDVLRANVPNLTEEQLSEYRQGVMDIDPITFISKVAPARIMFQMGTREEFFSRGNMQSLADEASEPKVVRWYDAGHSLNEEARQDRDHWLVEELFR
jgi:uncharacterized protein